MIRKPLRHFVFWPPFLVLVVSMILSFTNKEAFLAASTATNGWILSNFGWLFSLATLFFVIVCAAIMNSKFGDIRIGGKDATPRLKPWDWFAVTLCTTIATGILFWGVAEPMYHFGGPPASLGIAPNSPQAAKFALSTMFLHWSFTPYAIYSVPALTFALAFHNRKLPFSLASVLFPFFKGTPSAKVGSVVDAICLLALVLGMSASLGSGVLTIVGGLNHYFAIPSSPLILGLVCGLIVVSFCVSAVTGLMKGIRFLSDWNARIFIVLAIYVFFSGPTIKILGYGVEALGDYFGNFFQKSLFVGTLSQDTWPQGWSDFYWANWLAWAPVTAMFLGEIAYGYTVRAFLMINWIIPSLFAIVWMSIFSGTALVFQGTQVVDIAGQMKVNGAESAVYSMFQHLPLSGIVIGVFVFTTFLSYVTGADANTEAMGAISTEGVSADSPDAPSVIKLAWGAVIGMVSWVMISFAGIDGIKMLSNLGGLPALFLVLIIAIGITKTLVTGEYKNLD